MPGLSAPSAFTVTTYDHTITIDGWGSKITNTLKDGEGLIIQGIDFDQLQAIRNKISVLSHKRNDLN